MHAKGEQAEDNSCNNSENYNKIDLFDVHKDLLIYPE